VRASGSLNILGSISDGEEANVLSNVPSSSLRFVAGANLASANPLATLPGAVGNLTLGAANATASHGRTLVQTGTGDVDLVASGNVIINPFSSAYTTGVTPTNLGAVETPKGTGPMTYVTGGGSVEVEAGGNVLAAAVAGSVADWQPRDNANAASAGVWATNFTNFDKNPWSFATFGGGDIDVRAGGNVTTVTAAAADSMNYNTTAQLYPGGGLAVSAGGNITAGQFFVADGLAILKASGAVDTVPLNANLAGSSQTALGSVFDIMNSQISVWAAGAIDISGILNSTALLETAAVGNTNRIAFLSYSGDSSFSAQSTAGSVTLDTDSTNLEQALGASVGGKTNGYDGALSILPASLSLTSLTLDVDLLNGGKTLFASAIGSLNLFAGRDIQSANSGLTMSDAPISLLSTTANASGGQVGVAALTTPAYAFDADLHVDGTGAASVVAGRDIDQLTLSLPLAADIEAGRDIVNLQYTGQNLNPNDQTLIYAGRNFTDPIIFNQSGTASQSGATITVGGPGGLDVIAGADLDLGFSGGVSTVGNLLNANLPTTTGANITMLAGLGQPADYSAFLQKIIEPSATYQQELVAYVQGLTGRTGLSVGQADSQFAALGTDQQSPFIDDVFFSELNLSGLAFNVVGAAGYLRGYTAIDTLFPGTPTTLAAANNNSDSGDLELTYSQIYTKDGGNITLLAPGGSINAGLANPPAASTTTAKPPYELGIVAQGSGNVDIYTLDSVNVNSSRVFTLGGGNIVIWSQLGSIDAGNGAKTSLSLPPPTITYDAQGNPQVVFNAAVAGSGIRTIQSTPTVPAGSVNLIAPVGSVIAGDAGIGAAGNINLAAASVVGASNINFGVTATGVPAAVSNITASVSGAATAGAATTATQTQVDSGSSAQKSVTPQTDSAVAWLDVFVTGLGEDNCKPDDVECLKKQQSH
jgi:filamentous hemagglutinin